MSDESDGESDSDGGVQARDPTVQEEDSFDANGLRQDRQVRQTRPGTIPVYDVRSSPIKSWGLAIPGQLPNAPRYDKPAMCPWQLSFWDNISTDFKVGGKRSSFLIGVDTVSNGWRVKVQKGKFENGDSIDEVITEEALDKRPYKVTVASDGCGSMSLLRAAALSRGVDHWPLPPYAYDLNIAEGAVNHFKQMVSAVMLAAMVPGGPIDESFVGRAAEHMSVWCPIAGAWMASCPPGDTISVLMLVWHVQWRSVRRASPSWTRSCGRSAERRGTAGQNQC